MIGIYKISNPSGSVYIGQSWDIEVRWKKHKREYKFDTPLQRSFRKYGFINHTFQVLVPIKSEDITQHELDSLEIFWISVFRAGGFKVLNLKEGGSHGKHSPESIAKMRIAQQNMSESQKEKIRKSVQARDKEQITKLGLSNKGKRLGNQHAKGYKHTPEAIQKITQAGKTRSPEACRKNSECMKIIWAKRREAKDAGYL